MYVQIINKIKNLNTNLKIIFLNIFIIILVLISIEMYGRYYLDEYPRYRDTQPQPGQYQQYHPYLGFTLEGSIDENGRWWDPYTKSYISYNVKTNALGFRTEHEFSTTKSYIKKENEKVVLIFGGSAVFGFGNTSNDTTQAGWLEKILNDKNSKFTYKVFNLGNGGWIAYQQMIALNLYGNLLNPDWVIFMDGRNDVFTIIDTWGQDIGMPFNSRQVQNIVDGYLNTSGVFKFYRGKFENWLIENSHFYRKFTKQQPIKRYAKTIYYSDQNAYKTIDDVDKTIDFYLKTQESVLNQNDNSKYILSTQPIYRGPRTKMEENDRARLRNFLKDFKINQHNWRSHLDKAMDGNAGNKWEDIIQYSYGRITDEMPKICTVEKRCFYKEMDQVMTKNLKLKKTYFVDDVHLTDEGNQILAKYYAKIILRNE